MIRDESLSRLSAIKLALLAQHLRAESSEQSVLRAEPLAIVGMGCRFPGGASLEEFWQTLHDGVDTIREVPKDRWSWEEYVDADPSAPGKMTSRWGGFIEAVDGFDAPFFGISPREAAHLDPQQRLFLEVSYEALDDAGLTRAKLAGGRVGVFVSSYHNDYGLAQYAAVEEIDAYTGTGTSHSILANRLSYLLDLHGPSISVDTACSASLVALHLACESLRSGESNIAVAGGVTLMLSPEVSIGLSKWGFLAEDGRCKTFDTRANGFVRGEGAGVVVLKRLGDALADGDTIHGLVRGSAVNQDGRTSVLTAPSGLAQQAVVRAALANGGIGPEQISYIETHGTGTALGDPIEVEALAAVICDRPASERVVLGAVKTNIGHLEAAAGVAGVIKVLLAMRHELIPPNLHFTAPNPNMGSAIDLFELPTAKRPWPRGSRPRIAGVSSFGFGGTNAHVVLEEPPTFAAREQASRLPSSSRTEAANGRVSSSTKANILAISAQTEAALQELASRYMNLLRARPDTVGDICYTAALHRDHLDCRAAVVGENIEDILAGLNAIERAEVAPNLRHGRRVAGRRPRIALIFSGQGPQWWAMGRQLRDTEPVFRSALAECDAALRAHLHTPLLDEFDRSEATSRLNETEIAQPAIFAIQVALAALWKSWGIAAEAVVGHSVGEIAAAHISGALSLQDAARLVARRGQIMQHATGLGQMASVDVDEQEATDIARATAGSLSVAAINGPRSCVLSGDRKVLISTLRKLAERGVPHEVLPVDYAFHSAQMAPFAHELKQAMQGLAPVRSSIPLYSTVTGAIIDSTELNADYWGRNLRQTVRFADSIRALLESGIDTFIEVAPHPVLSAAVVQLCEQSRTAGTVVSSLRRGRPESQTIRTSIATLYAIGADVRWDALFSGNESRALLPLYPWQRTRYWLKPAVISRHKEQVHPLLGHRTVSRVLEGPLYDAQISTGNPDFLVDHRLGGVAIMPGTAFIEMAFSSLSGEPDGNARLIRNLFLHEPLRLPDGQDVTIQCTTVPAEDGFEFEILSADFSRSEQAWTVHATGSVARTTSPVPEVLDIDAIRARCPLTMEGEQLYAMHAERGIAFGPSFRSVRNVRYGAAELLAEIVAPEAIAKQRDYLVHPALLDACLQAILVLVSPQEGDERTMFVPHGCDSAMLSRRPGKRLLSHVVLRPGKTGASQIADVVISDDSGDELLRIAGLRIARIAARDLESEPYHAAANVYHSQWLVQEVIQGGTPSGTWLVLADRSGVGERLADRLRCEGAKVVIVHACEQFSRDGNRWAVRPGSPGDFASLVSEMKPGEGWAGVVHCWNIDARASAFAATDAIVRASEIGMASSLHLMQAFLRDDPNTPPAWLVSRGARLVSGFPSPIEPAQALQGGLARSLRGEHPDMCLTCVDLDPSLLADVDAIVENLMLELRASSGAEPEVAWRDDTRYVRRIARLQLEPPKGDGVRLVASTNHLLERLALQPLENAALGPGDVEIDVEAAGLNFRDVLNALGMLNDTTMPLGGECAGRVRRVGRDVRQFSVGARVMAFAVGSFASRVIVDARRVAVLPPGLDTTTAAGIPIAFLTAMYALNGLASLKRGERILVHAGTGGVGMAAIQLAMRAGAEVFATAGTPNKRRVLRELGVALVMDSRTLDFADEIRRFTSGQGVHVVLNSLIGEFVSKSVEVLVSGGRFIELGKRDIRSAAEMARLRPDVTYQSFDLADIAIVEPDKIEELFQELSALLVAGVLEPLLTRTWPLAEATWAFRHMAQAKHLGKIVLTHEARPSPLKLRADGCYLVTGGLGALGLQTARWMAARGAGHIILVGRQAPDEAAAAAIAEMKAAGTVISTDIVDIANEADVARMMDSIAQGEARLYGVVHAAGVLDDGVILEQNWERSARVLAPKVMGALALARHGKLEQLDFFICYSSATGVFSSPGQSSYSAANAYLDAFCQALRHVGVPATSIQWGPWRDGGMAARQGRRQASRLQSKGVRPMSAEEALSSLELALASQMGELAIVSVDWQVSAKHDDAVTYRALYEKLAVCGPKEIAHPPSLLKQLKALDSGRREVLLDHVRGSALRILGFDSEIEIEVDRPLREFGLDSLGAVELRNALSRSMDCKLPATLAFDHPTINAIASHLERILFPDEAKASSSTRGEEAIRELTEDDAEALLLAELNATSGGT
jgi:acyl transferase domain-containing protein/NADPH:quinone reductase-like Zn-dependent oxidoreductase/acyl carrier protein